MPNASTRIFPFLNTVILDSDQVFSRRLQTLLHILGVMNIHVVQSAASFGQLVDAEDRDLAFVEVGDRFDDVWGRLGDLRGRGALIVGVSDDRSGADWPRAIRRGADTILLKPFYPHLLREMLTHLVESPVARRCRIVQFPAARGRHS